MVPGHTTPHRIPTENSEHFHSLELNVRINRYTSANLLNPYPPHLGDWFESNRNSTKTRILREKFLRI